MGAPARTILKAGLVVGLALLAIGAARAGAPPHRLA
jgi:hypothetical protein